MRRQSVSAGEKNSCAVTPPSTCSSSNRRPSASTSISTGGKTPGRDADARITSWISDAARGESLAAMRVMSQMIGRPASRVKLYFTHNQHAHGLSLSMWVAYMLLSVLWVVYGLVHRTPPISLTTTDDAGVHGRTIEWGNFDLDSKPLSTSHGGRRPPAHWARGASRCRT